MTAIRLETDEPGMLQARLNEVGLIAEPLETKGFAEVHMLLVALGGGAGLATTITALGTALKLYFEERTEIKKASTIKLKTKDIDLEITGGNIDETMARLEATLRSASSR